MPLLPGNRLGPYEIVSSIAEELASSDNNQWPVSWSADGTILAFSELHPESAADIWTLSLDEADGTRSASPLLQTEFNEFWPMISPGGEWLAYESGMPEIYVRPFRGDDRQWQVSAAGGMIPRWNPNGRELFYRQGDKLIAVDVAVGREIVLSTPRELFERYSPNGFYDVAPDGERFLMVDTSQARQGPTELILVQNWVEELKRLVPTDN